MHGSCTMVPGLIIALRLERLLTCSGVLAPDTKKVMLFTHRFVSSLGFFFLPALVFTSWSRYMDSSINPFPCPDLCFDTVQPSDSFLPSHPQFL
ncbi:hypothetical protein K435DRAFT_714801 [Dendrothele bispora CBS 962.96]|uniref:Uncharacterized protein n=1 Tax=Dendrothele bispora (strain CBS 962.96) TaxID=1314807 RepID=A0A4S8MMX8_DENBC|nr:hypothetical protein K435DRAFT_714801 [Dendrothele bispora CBS 962.96]